MVDSADTAWVYVYVVYLCSRIYNLRDFYDKNVEKIYHLVKPFVE